MSRPIVRENSRFLCKKGGDSLSFFYPTTTTTCCPAGSTAVPSLLSETIVTYNSASFGGCGAGSGVAGLTVRFNENGVNIAGAMAFCGQTEVQVLNSCKPNSVFIAASLLSGSSAPGIPVLDEVRGKDGLNNPIPIPSFTPHLDSTMTISLPNPMCNPPYSIDVILGLLV